MDSLPVINRTYEIFKTITQVNHDLNKRWRFSLGMGTESTVTEFIKFLVMAKNSPRQMKGSYLINASASLEVLRMQLRLYTEFGLVNETKVFQLQNRIDEVGKMLGGWIKATYST